MFPAQFRRLGERLRQRLPKVGVGIDVGRSAVRVAVLRRGPAGTELLGLASSPVDAQTAAGPAPGVLRDVVRRACRSAYCWPRRVAMAVPANAVVARPVPVDAGAADEEVAEAIERAARQVPVAQADIAYQVEHRVEPVDRIAIRFHHRLVSIHPFSNGNGRHARLIADVLIEQLGAPRFSWGGSSSLVKASALKQQYISALQRADRGDLTALLAFARES